MTLCVMSTALVLQPYLVVLHSKGLQILEHPKSMTYNYHTQVSLSVSAIGPGPLSYKWKKDGVDIYDQDSTGVNESTLIIRSFSLKHEGMYTCKIKYNEKSVESNPANVQLSK